MLSWCCGMVESLFTSQGQLLKNRLQNFHPSTHICISPTIILQTTEVLSQASRGISLEALGLHGVYLEYHRGVYPYKFSF